MGQYDDGYWVIFTSRESKVRLWWNHLNRAKSQLTWVSGITSCQCNTLYPQHHAHLVPQCATWGFRNIYLNPNRAWTLVSWCLGALQKTTPLGAGFSARGSPRSTSLTWWWMWNCSLSPNEAQLNPKKYPEKIFETKKVWQTSPLAHWPWEVQSAGIPLSPLRHRDRIQQASTWRSGKGCLRTMSFPWRWSVRGFRRPLFESWT